MQSSAFTSDSEDEQQARPAAADPFGELTPDSASPRAPRLVAAKTYTLAAAYISSLDLDSDGNEPD
jgi:hypothetical protein